MPESTARTILALAEQGMSPKAIAAAAGCEVEYVYRVMARAGFRLERRFVRDVQSLDMKPAATKP